MSRWCLLENYQSWQDLLDKRALTGRTKTLTGQTKTCLALVLSSHLACTRVASKQTLSSPRTNNHKELTRCSCERKTVTMKYIINERDDADIHAQYSNTISGNPFHMVTLACSNFDLVTRRFSWVNNSNNRKLGKRNSHLTSSCGVVLVTMGPCMLKTENELMRYIHMGSCSLCSLLTVDSSFGLESCMMFWQHWHLTKCLYVDKSMRLPVE